jgi:two-component system, OmpR family, sensor histidine kinase CiaH
MFASARIKLTMWYVLVIAVVCAAFSGALYTINAREISRVVHAQRFALERRLQEGGVVMAPKQLQALLQLADPELERDARRHFLRWLIGVDVLIILGSAGLAYWWAGRALSPINDMMQKQKRFVSDASHELKTPLTALRTSLEVALRDGTMTLAEAKQVLTESLADVIQLQTLSTRLLKLSAYQETLPSDIEQISPAKIAAQAIRSITPIAKEKGITIEKNLQDFMIKASPSQLLEVLMILLDNATKYTPEKGKITVTVTKRQRTASIAISDTGPGIPAEDQPYIFDRFFRTDKARSHTDGSVGLGLAIAHQIVKNHKGEVSVKSKPGYGSIFTITLPI